MASQTLSVLKSGGVDVHRAVRTLEEPAGSQDTHIVDLLDKRSIDRLIDEVRPSMILHLAWCTKPGSFWNDPENSLWVDASTFLAKTLFERGGSRFILASTCAVYDWTLPQPKLTRLVEAERCGSPATRYGRAKLEAADAIELLASKHGAEWVDARLFFPMGVGENANRFLPYVITSLLQGHPAYIGPEFIERDVLDVRDVGRAIGLLAASTVTGAVNVASGRAIRLSDLARQAAEQIGRPELLHVGARPARQGDPACLAADVTRLEQELGFSPIFGMRDLLHDAVNWWQEQLRTSPKNRPIGS